MVNKVPNRSSSEEKEGNIETFSMPPVDGMIINDLESGLVVEANPAACKMHGYTREEFIGLQSNRLAYIPTANMCLVSPSKRFNQTACSISPTLHMRRDGSTFYAEWRGTAFTYQGRPCLLSIVRDVSQRIQTEQLLSERVETRTHEQATLLEISHTLASTLELQPGLILDQLREIIEYTHGGLFALEDSSLVTLAMRGTEQLEQSAPIRIHLNTPETLVALFNRHQPIRIADVWSDNPQAQFLRSLLDDGAAVLLEGMQSWMWVPLAVKGRIIGGMGVAHEKRRIISRLITPTWL